MRRLRSRRDFLIQGIGLGGVTAALGQVRPGGILARPDYLDLAAGPESAPAPAAPTIDIDTTNWTPIQPGFSGVNTDLTIPIEYWDYRYNALASQMGYGWLRFPGGTSGDIYDWQSGEEVKRWLDKFIARGRQSVQPGSYRSGDWKGRRQANGCL